MSSGSHESQGKPTRIVIILTLPDMMFCIRDINGSLVHIWRESNLPVFLL